jgi:hypothetical protein
MEESNPSANWCLVAEGARRKRAFLFAIKPKCAKLKMLLAKLKKVWSRERKNFWLKEFASSHLW